MRMYTTQAIKEGETREVSLTLWKKKEEVTFTDQRRLP